LASENHDDENYFQYFAMEFKSGSSAIHGANIVSQAYATNKALENIRLLYEQEGTSIGGLLNM
jgi:hypothetical protein